MNLQTVSNQGRSESLYEKFGYFFIMDLVKTSVFVILISAVSASNYNASSESECICELRYLQHYESKGCKVEETNSCGCPIKFSCPENYRIEDQHKECVYQNKTYKLGSKINSADICQMCWCRGRFNPQIQCRTRECPQTEVPDGDNCHPLYEKDRCCPVEYKCVAAADGNNETQAKRICEYNGVFYPLGARVYPSYDPCLICSCVLNDNGDNELHCHKQDCLFERYKSKIDAGCVPVYHEKKCCPVEFHCPETKTLNYTVMENEDALNESDVQSGDHCIFSGKFYKIDAELAISNPCIKCRCLVPPDFTCIHQSCPPPPNAKNCYASKTTGQCCPYYECLIGDSDANYDWDDVVTEIVCPTPLCADESCHIGIPEGHMCPTCICSAQTIPTTFPDTNSSNSENATHPEVDNEEGVEKNDEELKSKNLTNFQDIEELLSNQIDEKDFEKIREDFENSDNHSSGHFQRMVREEQDQSVFSQQQQELNSDTELEREPFSEDQDEYDAELQSFQKSKKNENADNVLGHSIEPISSELVPDGCPTPICENSTCRILIPTGERCPTCVCESRGDRQP